MSSGTSSAPVQSKNSGENWRCLWQLCSNSEDTNMLTELCWARVLVKLGKSEPPNTVEVMVEGTRFRIQLWWELSPSQMIVSSS